MAEGLQKTVAHLYDVFSKYPFNPNISGCPCCIHEADKNQLHAKPLNELTDDDLSRYTHKAMTTWGDVDDYKYYLPRIIELICSPNSLLDFSATLYKLDYGKWKTWETEEINALRSFLNEWWVDQFLNHTISSIEMMDLYDFLKTIDFMVDLPLINFKDNSFKNYLYLMMDYQHILNNENEYASLNKEDYAMFLSWITKNIPLIEEAFFYFEVKDPEFSADISYSLYFIERAFKYN